MRARIERLLETVTVEAYTAFKHEGVEYRYTMSSRELVDCLMKAVFDE